MTVIQVWAPDAKAVELSIADKRLAMVRQEHGWWLIEAGFAIPGVDYTFILDGGEALPDPRSQWQPHGVHGRSRLFDHTAFKWTDSNWIAPELKDAVVYELHIGTFTPEGTFDSAIARLPHLAELGVTHVELMPVAEFSGDRGWGYDGVDLFAPHHAYGGPTALKRLVDACHAHGLAAILDVVYNHFGPSGNYLPRFGPYLTRRYKTPWGDAVNFDARGSDEVRRLLCDSALMWLRDYHFDALRIDAVHAIVDISALHFLEQLASEVATLGAQLERRFVLIAESDLNDPRIVRSVDVGGYGIDAQWSDDFHHALHALLTGERAGYYSDFGSFADLAKAFTRAFVYDGVYSEYRGRRHGRPPTGLSGDRFFAYLQDHDQIGNRAKGDRSSALMSQGRLMIAAALVLTTPFVPMVFQGEEWGASTPFLYFSGHPERELGRAVSEGRRHEFATFGWNPVEIPDPQDPASFARSKLQWSEAAHEPHKSLLQWHRDLIRLRKLRPELRDGRLDKVDVRFDEEARWLVVGRGPLRVACNIASEIRPVPLSEHADWKLLLSSHPSIRAGAMDVSLPPDSVAILSRD
jgi:maltooligosyltrehalose trehalohydrolase